VEIAIQKILEQNLLPNIDHQLIFIAQLTKQGVSPKI
jgi:hypothetical protein